MYKKFIRDRISELRIKKGISEYKMSIDLGHSNSYIQSIVSGRALPSISEFLFICKYFGITPKEFFDDDIKEPILVQKAIDGIKNLDEKDLGILITVIERLNENK